MRIFIIVLLILGAHFNLTANMPGPQALIYWPFAADTRPAIALFGAYPNAPTRLLSAVAGFGFIAALLAVLGWLVPAGWFGPLVGVAAVASIALYILYFGSFALMPLAVDAVLLWGVLTQGWSAAGL